MLGIDSEFWGGTNMRGIGLRAHRTVLSIGLSTVAMSLTCPTTAWALNFPADNAWIALTRGGTAIGDVAGDSSAPVLDLVGDVEHPMSYVQSDATHLYFRVRVDREILQNATNVRPYGWGCVIDTNGDPSSFEFSAVLDGVSNPDAVTLWPNLLQEMPNNPGDSVGPNFIHSYLGPFNVGLPGYGYARQIMADTMFGSPNATQDYFADWAIERSKLGSSVTDKTPLRFACGSASNGKDLNQDFSGPANLPDLFSDPVLCDAEGCYAQTCAEYGQACSVGIGGCAATGTVVCLRNGSECNAIAGQPGAELCNGVDDDCNGTTDEGNPGSGEACISGQPGICAAGTTICTNGALVCNPDTGQQIEVCNGLDDDCNGIPDDGPAGAGDPCVTGYVGVCAEGYTTCDGGKIQCSAMSLPGVNAEICNGLDDDCNGLPDDGFAVGSSCTVGIGACASTGKIFCNAGGIADCSAAEGVPVTEICGDLIDGDCDGQLDNNCPDTDGDGILDHIETQIGSDPNDADSDDDGVRDGMEADWDQDSDKDGKINALDPDSDDDKIFDGTEMGFDCSGPGTDIKAGNCVADMDNGLTTTNPIEGDTDAGSLPDGEEDTNQNGMIDMGEKNPLDPKDDIDVIPTCSEDAQCIYGEICVDGDCMTGCRGDMTTECPLGEYCETNGSDIGVCQPSGRNNEIIVEGGGCSCQMSSPTNLSIGIAWALSLLGILTLRRRRS
jgi:MYXO-CTERM domain-containing protein